MASRLGHPMTIRIGTSERDGTFYSQGRALKSVFERRPALAPVEVLESRSASTESANRLDAQEIEFGFMASNWIGRAKNGEAPLSSVYIDQNKGVTASPVRNSH
jgi:TRAP-type uncharacterized transport system substrate-binding protein